MLLYAYVCVYYAFICNCRAHGYEKVLIEHLKFVCVELTEYERSDANAVGNVLLGPITVVWRFEVVYLIWRLSQF